MGTPSTPVEVFYSFAEADAPLLKQLEKHLSLLQHEGLITTWHKRQILAGTDWKKAIDRQLDTASLILLLISPDFLASDYCYGVEMRRAMQRYETGEAQVIPLLLRPIADWQNAPFGKLKTLPSNGKPVTAWSNRDAAFVDIAQGIRVALDGVQPLPPSPTLSGVWNVPYHRNPHFTGRDELLDRLAQQLGPEAQEQGRTTRRAALTQPQVIKGLGGIGKTQIAIEYAYRSRDLGQYTHTFWVNASEETLLTSFAALADLLPAFPAKGETDQRKLVKAIIQWLEQYQERWLLIFDNADEVALLRDYLPQSGNGSILLTTRAHAVGSLATSIEVETMGFIEGTHLLLHRAQRLEQASDEEVNQAGNIVVALDHFPLALDQAGAYIEETGCSFTGYLEIYQNHRKALLARRGEQTVNYPDSVATTWLLSLQKVQQANPAAAEFLQLCAFLAPDRIPEELIKDGAAHWPSLLKQAATDRFAFNQMIEELLKFSLVKRLVKDHTLSIHRLVQEVQKDRMDVETQRQWAERVVLAVNHVFPDDPHDIAAWPQCLRYLDQAQVSYALVERYGLAFVEAANILDRAGLYLQDHAVYAEAEPLYLRALAIREQQLGVEHPDTATSLNNLATLYRAQGKYEQAEPLYQRALAIHEKRVGNAHPSTATSLNNLASLYQEQGKYEQAEPLYQRALTIREQQLGAEHPDTATSFNNLASLYYVQRRYSEAEPLLKRALTIYEQQLGAEHPTTRTIQANYIALVEAIKSEGEADS